MLTAWTQVGVRLNFVCATQFLQAWNRNAVFMIYNTTLRLGSLSLNRWFKLLKSSVTQKDEIGQDEDFQNGHLGPSNRVTIQTEKHSAGVSLVLSLSWAGFACWLCRSMGFQFSLQFLYHLRELAIHVVGLLEILF